MENRRKLTFKIVEGDDDFDWDSFTKDYVEMKLTRKQICEKYDLSLNQYGTRSRRVQRDTGFKRPKGHSPLKHEQLYIHPTRYDTYSISKRINDGTERCLTVSDKETAIKVRDILVENDWSLDVIDECRRKYGTAKGRKTGDLLKSPVRFEALKHYDEFKKLFFDFSLTGADIERKLGITKYQYYALRDKLTMEIGEVDRGRLRHGNP